MDHDELIDLGTQLSDFVVGAEGNISQRSANGFWITASGKHLKLLDNSSFIRCDVEGVPHRFQHGGFYDRPSIETGFHALLYKNLDCQVVAHTHPTNTLKVLCTEWSDEFAHRRMFPDQVVFNGARSCVVPYATPGSALVRCMDHAINDFFCTYNAMPNVFLLRNHGLVCCANSVREAVTMTEICEKSAEIFMGANLSRYGRFLSHVQVAEIQEHEGEAYRRKQ